MSTAIEHNQAALAAELDWLASRLERHAAGDSEPAHEAERGEAPVLDTLAGAFGLSPFERDLLLLCAGVELDARFPPLCAATRPGDGYRRPTFGLALSTLPDAHWSALAPAAPLRRWHLIELDPGETLTGAPLRIDERVLHHLTGVDYIDPRLAALIVPVPSPPTLPASHEEAAEQLAACCRTGIPAGVAVVSGADRYTRRAVVATALERVGLRLYALSGHDVPSAPEDREQLARLWERDALLSRVALLIELEDAPDAELQRRTAACLDAIAWGAFVSGADPVRVSRPVPRIEVSHAGAAEQRRLWEVALGPAVAGLNGSLDRLVSQFDLGPHEITAAATQVDPHAPDLAAGLWHACRGQARPALDDLAQRIDPRAGWDDLVLGEEQRGTLREITMHVRGRGLVHDRWGFADRSTRGLGISALFEGPSGTGKTMAAEVLARVLELDLYRIDLSQVVSKYIGETEKNLRRVFDAAESGGVILLFDEADALFGKRSEVKDSHDRYANIEIGYLLTRMEAYRGLAILTTNAKDAIDPAFLRRIRFVVRFAYPGAAERAEIWRRAFPSRTPTEQLDPVALAQVSLTGANIANVALGAAFLAADAGESVRMRHIAQAAMRERAKLDAPLSHREVSGWT